MKGRIIGREGRNIRTLETLTGVDLIIDDTPEAITFLLDHEDEVARIALEKLIADGRIHRLELKKWLIRQDAKLSIKLNKRVRGLPETNVHGINNELIKLIGRLRFRKVIVKMFLTIRLKFHSSQFLL